MSTIGIFTLLLDSILVLPLVESSLAVGGLIGEICMRSLRVFTDCLEVSDSGLLLVKVSLPDFIAYSKDCKVSSRADT